MRIRRLRWIGAKSTCVQALPYSSAFQVERSEPVTNVAPSMTLSAELHSMHLTMTALSQDEVDYHPQL